MQKINSWSRLDDVLQSVDEKTETINKNMQKSFTS